MKVHYAWGVSTRCGHRVRLIMQDRVHDAEIIAAMGGEAFLKMKRWVAKVCAGEA